MNGDQTKEPPPTATTTTGSTQPGGSGPGNENTPPTLEERVLALERRTAQRLERLPSGRETDFRVAKCLAGAELFGEALRLVVGPVVPLAWPGAFALGLWWTSADVLPALAAWISKGTPDAFITAVFSWPIFGVLVLLLMGPRWLRDYIGSIRKFGPEGLERAAESEGAEEGKRSSPAPEKGGTDGH